MKPKIQLPWANESEPGKLLSESKTLAYWEASRAWNGHGENITVAEAIALTNKVMYDCNPSRVVFRLAGALRDNIVNFGTRKNYLKELRKNASNSNSSRPKLLTVI